MRIYTYKLKFDNEWLDISSLINSADTEIKNALCTTAFKSVTNDCSFTIRPSNGLFYAQIAERILNARTERKNIEVEISDYKTEEILFSGILDDSSITITSARIPDSLELSARDYITTLLDKKIKLNIVLENRNVSEIVQRLMSEAGYDGDIEIPSSLASLKCKYFVITDDDSSTFRDVIDTLLYEIPGYVIYRNPKTSKYEIREIVPSTESIRTVNYLIGDKLQTKTEIYDHDGIKLSYPTIAESSARPVFVADVDVSSPAEIPADHYYPENGDVQATYQEYDKNILDRAYNLKETRRQNSDLDILYVKNTKLNVYPGDVWDFPVLSSLDMPSNPVWLPRKAWVLLHNKTDAAVNLELMNIEGDAVYRSKINNIVFPQTASDPEEYSSSYIFDEEHAVTFSKWFYGMKTVASTTSTWTEVNLASSLGEKVIISHKDSSVSQAHVVVQIKNTALSNGIRAYKITAVAISNFDDYEYSKDVRVNSTGGKSIYQEYDEYYNSTSNIELKDGTWSKILTIDPDKTLWTRRIVRYTDGSIYYSTATPSGSRGKDGEPGKDGQDGSYLSFNVSRTGIDYYADDYPVDNSAIILSAESDINVTITLDGKTATKTATEVEYTVLPSILFASKDSVIAIASTARMKQTYTISKLIRKGSLSVTADKSVIPFYADNVPHDENDKITLYIESFNYKNYPKLYLNGVLQKTEEASSYTFEVGQSAFVSQRDITVKVVCGQDYDLITLSKFIDNGSISISSSLSEFSFYADNVPKNSTDKAVLTITQNGYSKMPVLYINEVEKQYESANANGTGTGSYILTADDMLAVSSITARISNELESSSLTIGKSKDIASIELQVSEPIADYWYDNVAITGDIIASVRYSGLYYAPLLKAGNTAIAISDDGKGVIPISLFDSVDSGLTVTAYAQKNITYATSVSVPKQKRPLALSLGTSGAQFSYDRNGNASPASIKITNYTTGLSDNSKVQLLVGGEIKAWTDNEFTVTPDMVTGRYLVISIGYGSESSSLIITKTYDGKTETIEYSKSKSFKIYPDDEYEFIYNDEGVTYNGETMAWIVPWSEIQPDVYSDEYLWRRSRTSEDEEWQYTRLTGVKGDDGKAGLYLGHYLEEPALKPDGSEINEGDFYLNTSEPGNPLPYIYKNGVWLLVTAESAEWSQIASATMSDVNNYGGSLLSSSAYYGFFQLLSAQKAFLESLGTQDITLNKGGAIKSENYDTSGGADGFRIDSNGDVDFNSGTWRGSFANGLSFIPVTNLAIKKTMTHKEAYEKMKKAGIVEGVYKVADAFTPINDATVTSQGNILPQRFTTAGNSGDGLNITEYGNNLSCAIPLMCSSSSGFIPLTVDIYLMFEADITSANTTYTLKSLNAYLVNKSMVAHNSNYYMEGATEETDADLHKYPVDISSWNISSFIKEDVLAIYGAAVDGKIMIMTGQNTASVYSLNESSMSLALAGTVDFSADGFFPIRYQLPSFYFHKKGSYYEIPMYKESSNQFIFRQTSDLIAYTDIGTAYTYVPATGASVFRLHDVIKVGTRIFAQIYESFTRNGNSTSRYYFAEYNASSQRFEQIPDIYTCVEGIDTINIVPLYEKNGVIIGSFSGYDLFSYDTNTNIYTDLSGIFRGALPYWVQYAEQSAPVRKYNTLPSARCFRSENNSDTTKYSRIFYNPNINIQAVQYSSLYDCFLIAAKIECVDNPMGDADDFVMYKYDAETGNAEMMSPMTWGRSHIPCISPYIEDSNGNYAIAMGWYILTSDASSSDYLNIELNNISAEDLIGYLNGDKTLATLFGVSDASLLPWWIKMAFSNGMKEFFTGKSLRANNLKLLNSEDSKIRFNEPYPLINIKKAIIREDEDSYKIIIADQLSYMHLAYGPMFNLVGGLTYGNYFRWHIHTNGSSIEPVITIKKNSTEPLGISFYWDFPAQFTISEDIKKVVKDEIFCDYAVTN